MMSEQILFSYDSYLEEDYDNEIEHLHEICTNIIAEYGTVVKYGFFGAWDGPKYGGSFIDTPELLFGHITQDFTVPMAIELKYIDEDDSIAEIQRYSHMTSLDVEAGSLLLLQHHHDGCNQYIIRAVDGPIDDEYNVCEFIEWAENNSYPIDLDLLISGVRK